MMLRLMSRAPVLLAMLVLVVGCATPRVQVPEPLALPPPPEQATDSALRAARTVEQATMQVRETPAPPAPDGIVSAGSDVGDDIPPGLSGPPVSINVTNVPIPTFVNDVLGETLNLTFQVDPKIESLNELVTVRTSRPQQPVELFRLARQILADYGIEMLVEGDVVRLRMAPAGSRIEPPLIYSGRALPDVPVTHRPVFYLMELDAIRATEASRWLKAIYGDDVAIEASNERNALLISGRPAEVRQAVEAIQVFDRPYMRGRESIRLEPAFLSAQELSSKLTQMLVAEGYGAADTLGAPASVLVLPVPAVNSVILFAGDRELLRHAVDWARELDRPNPAAGANSIFYYPVKNTKAADIADVLGGAGGSTIAAPQDPDTATAAAAPTRRANAGRSLVVDEPRNALIFQGDPAEWERLLPLIRQMDREARQVMIEMTIAEVTLDDNEEFGLSWFAKGDTGRFNGRLDFGSLPTSGEGLGGSGLTYLLDVAGQSRALLKAFADDQRVLDDRLESALGAGAAGAGDDRQPLALRVAGGLVRQADEVVGRFVP